MQLDPVRAADRIAPQPLVGPFGEVTAGCDDCTREIKPARKPVLAKPFEAVELRRNDVALIVAVRVAGQWYRTEVESERICFQTADPRDFGVRRIATVQRGKQLVLELDYDTSVRCGRLSGGRYNNWRISTRGTLVVGVGSSGKPSAPPPIPLGAHVGHGVDREPTAADTSAYAATLRWMPDGSARLDGTVLAPWGFGPDELAVEDWLGAHVLAFP